MHRLLVIALEETRARLTRAVLGPAVSLGSPKAKAAECAWVLACGWTAGKSAAGRGRTSSAIFDGTRGLAPAMDPELTPRRARLARQFVSPKVVRAHELRADVPAPDSAKLRRKFRRPAYMAALGSDAAFRAQLVRVAQAFPLCRFCLLRPGNICEHSHPHERNPRPHEIPARALTACAACNAAEREALKAACAAHGDALRRTHVDLWPHAARRCLAAELARRVSARRAAAGASPMRVSRAMRILKFAPCSRRAPKTELP